jgi:hypothetical protein
LQVKQCKKAIPIPNDFNVTHFCPECGTEFELGRIPSFSYFTSKVSENCWIKRAINDESEK